MSPACLASLLDRAPSSHGHTPSRSLIISADQDTRTPDHRESMNSSISLDVNIIPSTARTSSPRITIWVPIPDTRLEPQPRRCWPSRRILRPTTRTPLLALCSFSSSERCSTILARRQMLLVCRYFQGRISLRLCMQNSLHRLHLVKS